MPWQLDRVLHPLTTNRGIELWLLHSPMSPVNGNKAFKLAPSLRAAREQNKHCLLSFGGAWSNHLVSLSYAARSVGLRSIGLVRGESAYRHNAALSDARSQGMLLRFLTREQYRQRHSADFLSRLQQEYPEALIVPEGGSTVAAAQACADMLSGLPDGVVESLDVIAVAVGTGATLTGIRSALSSDQQVRGYAVVADKARAERMACWWRALNAKRTAAAPASAQARLCLVDAIDPGYAQLSSEHWTQVRWFAQHMGVWLDPVYTVKMVASIFSELERGVFAPGTRLLMIHTGGWQGWRGQVDHLHRTHQSASSEYSLALDIVHRYEATLEQSDDY